MPPPRFIQAVLLCAPPALFAAHVLMGFIKDVVAPLAGHAAKHVPTNSEVGNKAVNALGTHNVSLRESHGHAP